MCFLRSAGWNSVSLIIVIIVITVITVIIVIIVIIVIQGFRWASHCTLIHSTIAGSGSISS